MAVAGLRDAEVRVSRAMTLWMKKHREGDKDGVQSYPWETKCLSAGEFSEWKISV